MSSAKPIWNGWPRFLHSMPATSFDMHSSSHVPQRQGLARTFWSLLPFLSSYQKLSALVPSRWSLAISSVTLMQGLFKQFPLFPLHLTSYYVSFPKASMQLMSMTLQWPVKESYPTVPAICIISQTPPTVSSPREMFCTNSKDFRGNKRLTPWSCRHSAGTLAALAVFGGSL